MEGLKNINKQNNPLFCNEQQDIMRGSCGNLNKRIKFTILPKITIPKTRNSKQIQFSDICSPSLSPKNSCKLNKNERKTKQPQDKKLFKYLRKYSERIPIKEKLFKIARTIENSEEKRKEQLVNIKKIIGNDYDLEYRFKEYFNRTLLHTAVINQKIELVEYLISKGADINTQDYFGDTPLHSITGEYNYEIKEMLLKQEYIKASIKNNLGQTPLMKAVINGQVENVELLLENINLETIYNIYDNFVIRSQKGKNCVNYICELYSNRDFADIVFKFYDRFSFEGYNLKKFHLNLIAKLKQPTPKTNKVSKASENRINFAQNIFNEKCDKLRAKNYLYDSNTNSQTFCY